MLIGLLPSAALAIAVTRRKRSLSKGIAAGVACQCCWSIAVIILLVVNGDPARPGARTILQEELNGWNTNPEQDVGRGSGRPADGLTGAPQR